MDPSNLLPAVVASDGFPPNPIAALGAVVPVVFALEAAFVDLATKLCDPPKGLLGDMRAKRDVLSVLMPRIPTPAEMIESLVKAMFLLVKSSAFTPFCMVK